MSKTRKHINIGFMLVVVLVLIAGLRGLPENSTPGFGIPVAIALMVISVAIAINYRTTLQSCGEGQEKKDKS